MEIHNWVSLASSDDSAINWGIRKSLLSKGMDVDNSATLAVGDNMAIKRKKKTFTH